MKKYLLLCLSFLAVLPMTAQDSVYARRIICDLSSAAMYGRGYVHRGDSIAADYLRAELRALGYDPLGEDYYQYFELETSRTQRVPLATKGYLTQNVIGVLPGETDSMLVLTAHYDHLGTHGDTIYYGAHDNASGCAAVLDMARTLARDGSKYTIVVMFFSGEELGLEGSHYAIQNPLIDYRKVRLLCNIDMFCGGDDGLMIFNAHDRLTKPFIDRVVRLNEAMDIATLDLRENRPNSDHYWFSSQCPAIFCLSKGGPIGGYHSPFDTCPSCGLGYYENYLTLLLALLIP